MHKNELLSVIMVVRDGLPYLPYSVNSILDQDHSDFSLIIVDNDSQDKTFDYLNSFDDERIQLFHYNKVGIPHALNFGLSKSDSKYIAIMDADDISHKNRLKSQLDFLENNPDIGLIGSSINYFTELSSKKWTNILPQTDEEIRAGLFRYEFMISHPTVMIRTNLIKKVGGYRDKYKFVPDLDLFLRLSKITKFANLPYALLDYRISSLSFTQQYLYEVLKEQRIAVNSFLNKNNNIFLDKIITQLNFKSQMFYRNAINHFLNESVFLYWIFLFFSAVLKPSKAIRKLKRMRIK